MFEHDKQDFPVVTPWHTLARFMAHYELFKLVKDVPGCIVDIGVGSGGSTYAFGAMCRTFCRQSADKQVFGFDTFEGFPAVSPEDGSSAYCKSGEFCFPRPVGASDYGITLITGNIEKTVPQFVQAHPELKIALLNLDADLYAPTKTALELLEPLVSPSGVIIADEYDRTDVFPGERRAIDEYYKAKTGRIPIMARFPWCSNPSAWLIMGQE